MGSEDSPNLPADAAERMVDAFERWNRGDRDPRTEDIHPDFELVSSLTELSGKPYRGLDGFRQWVRDMDSAFEQWQIRADDIRAAGDSLLVLGGFQVRGRGSGVKLDQPVAWIYEFEQGKVRHMHVYRDRAEALRAIGLTEADLAAES